MTSLIAMLSSGKGTWGQVNSLINQDKWDKIYLICNEYAFDNFKVDPAKIIKLKLDEKNLFNNIGTLSNFFKKDIKDFEVAINIVSGSGLEHMALLSAILKAGLGLRFVYNQSQDIEEIKILEHESDEEGDDSLYF